MSEIQPKLLTLDELLYGRLFQIPEYQRNYSWQKKQRSDLFEDIEQTWRMGGARPHFMATIVGLRRGKETILTKVHQIIEIVDGQQRITTLILLLKAIAKFLDLVEGDNNRIVKDLGELLVKPDKASVLLLQTNHDTGHFFANYLRTGTHPNANTAKTLGDRELLLAIEECEGFVAEWLRIKGRTLEDLLSLVKNRMNFVFHEISDEALVYTVFEVLNSRGLDVSWFDRLKSMLMAIVFEAKSGNEDALLKEVHDVWADIYRCVGLRLGMNTESLRFAATLQESDLQNRILSEEKAAYALRDTSSAGAEMVIKMSRWLKDVTDAMNNLVGDRRRNAVTRIVQARIVATAINLRQDFTQEQRDTILRRWENVTFRIYGMYSKDARTAVGEYVRLAWRIMNERLSSDTILQGLSHLGRDHPIEKAIEHMRGYDCYNEWHQEVRYFFYRYEEYLANKARQTFDNEQWNRIWMASASKSIEHILPQSTGDSDYIHSIGNLLILPPGLNSQLWAKPPREKGDAYRRTGLLMAQELTSLLSGWGPEAIRKREDKLLKWALREWAD